ncbi:ABC transporter permease [Agrobacterium sp. BA1120]|uniref:ABC transporter permease n=1 Tax=Agrobacterium sp. BA1120 TaxID=3228927 RepID=UPI00336A39D7
MLAIIGTWHLIVQCFAIPPYFLPRPQTVFETLIADRDVLFPALSRTAVNTLCALGLSALAGVVVAILVASSRILELFVSPVLICLQVTPIVALAPLILVYAPSEKSAQLFCAFLVSFFPIFANTLRGLKSIDRDQYDMVSLYTGSRLTIMRVLQIPSALPGFFAGLKISGGLALVGTIVAEFTAGSAGPEAGLAFRLIEAQYRLNMPRLFAAIVLLALLGSAVIGALAFADRIVLRHWHAMTKQLSP